MEALEKGFLTKLTELLNPLTEKIGQLTLSIQKVNSIVQGAMDLSMLQQEDIKTCRNIVNLKKKNWHY